MSSRSVHLFSLRVADALRHCWAEGYGLKTLQRDVIAGATVGIVAIPLSMSFAIASGVAPEFGLYSAVIAGVMMALLGGSRYSVSGPSAAFIIVLSPIAQQYGVSGVLMATVMAGFMLFVMALGRVGRYLEYIPEPVTLGFTAGIASAVVLLQIPDFTGMPIEQLPLKFADKLVTIFSHWRDISWPALGMSAGTVGIMLLWPKLGLRIPAHFPALITASVVAWFIQQHGFDIQTVGARFEYVSDWGETSSGIPPYLPTFEWPWRRDFGLQGDGAITLGMLSDLLPAAFALAVLAALEALLCAVVLDAMSGKRHSANSELLALGCTNVLTPFFGGITSTSEIARSTTNFRSGAVSPIAAALSAVVVLLGLLFLAQGLAYIPMAALSAILIVTAWNMSRVHRCVNLIRRAANGEIVVFAICLLLTVTVDMVIAVAMGVLLASILFVKDVAGLTKVVDMTPELQSQGKEIPEHWRVLRIRGLLFFAAADRIFEDVQASTAGLDGVILHMQESTYLDTGGISTIERLITTMKRQGVEIRFVAWQFQPLKALAKARAEGDSLSPLGISFASLDEALHDAAKFGLANRVSDVSF